MTSPDIYDAIDLFAGPGGWDVAAHSLGIRVLGIEWDHAACETRRAADLPTIEGDVRQYGPADFPGVKGFIASPPCQTFSMAGGGAGRRALDVVLEAIKALEAREDVDYAAFDDERTGLVLEPLRWALDAIDHGEPFEWLAFEQVPTVLPVWEAMADVLRREGYSVAVGKLSSEQYGVPQTRKRAILVARLRSYWTCQECLHTGSGSSTPVVCRCGATDVLSFERDVEAELPAPTHRPYKKGTPQDAGDPELLPWVSMAEALGWGATERPGMTVTGGGTATGGAEPFGNAARQALAAERGAGRWIFSATNVRPNSALRDAETPAPSPAFGHESPRWVHERPATSVQGDPRIGQPGHKCMTDECHPGRGKTRQFDEGSVRVTSEEAATLQSFPSDHPWQGNKGKVFQQIGNAVPPLLARAVLAAVTA